MWLHAQFFGRGLRALGLCTKIVCDLGVPLEQARSLPHDYLALFTSPT